MTKGEDYNGPKVIKESRKKDYTSHMKEVDSNNLVKTEEAASIKMMFHSGSSKSAIAKATGRSLATVSKVIDNFEQYMPDDESLKEKINAHMDRIADTLMGRSLAIIDKADEVVYERIDNPEVSPLEASKVSQRYADRFANIVGENRLKSSKAKEKSHDEEKVNQILQNVFNINVNMEQSKDDRHRKSSTTNGEDSEPAEGGEEGGSEKTG